MGESNTNNETAEHEMPHESNDSNKENNGSNNRTGANGRNNRNSNGSKNMRYSTSQPYNWKGRSENFGVILALKSERYENKALYSSFVERLKNHAIQKFTHGNDIVSLIENYEDPTDAINAQFRSDTKRQLGGTQQTQSQTFMKTSATVKQETGDDDDDASDGLPLDTNAKIELLDNDVQTLVMKELVKNHINRVTTLDMNKMKLYGLIWGQLTTGLQEVIKGDEDFTNKDLQFDCIWLLTKCKLVTAGLDERANKHSTYVTAIRQAFSVRQRDNESNDAYRKRLESHLLILDLVGGKHVISSPDILKLIKQGAASATDIINQEQRTKGMMLILGADPTRFQALQDSLEEGVLLGRDEYPTTITQAYELLQSTCPNTHQQQSGRFSRFRNSNRFRMGNLSFAQVQTSENTVPGSDGRVFEHIKCHGCHSFGHYRNQCPKNRQVTLAQFVLSQQELASINPNWILLDTCSTVSVYCNKKLVKDIHPCPPNQELHIVTNGGSESFPYTATANLLPISVHFNPHSLANILALSDVANIPGARLTMDTQIERAILLHINDAVYKFLECKDGLYYYDTSSDKNNITTSLAHYNDFSLSHSCFLQRVDENKSFYTRRQIEGADTARKLQASIGYPSTTFFKHLVQHNHLRNCGITADDISRAERIYGPPPPLLQGKSTRTTPKAINIHHTPLPLQIQERHKEVSLHIDFFYVNGHPFLHTKSEKLNFLTVQSGKTRNTQSIKQGLLTVLNLYQKRGFIVKNIFGDNEFDIAALHDALLPVILHIFASGEHCPIAERSIRTIKERGRCICHGLPYKRYTKLMIYMLVECIIYWLNSFPSQNGVSSSISPAGIVTGRQLPDFNNKHIPFGAYAWVFTKTTNTMKARRVPAIALCPSNEWGGHYFMSLYTGKKLHSYDWVETPIDDEVIARVEELAEAEGQPIVSDHMPLFEWGIGREILEIEEDKDEYTHVDNDSLFQNTDLNQQIEVIDQRSSEQDTNSIPIVNTIEDNEHLRVDDLGPDPDQLNEDESADVDESLEISGLYKDMETQLDNEIEEILQIPDTYGLVLESEDEYDDNIESENNTETITGTTNDSESNTDAETGMSELRSVRRTTRANAGKRGPRLLMDTKGKDYKSINYNFFMHQQRIKRVKKKVILTTLKNKSNYINHNNDNMRKAIGVIFAQQMSAKKGIKLFGQEAIAALMKEFSQLDNGAFPGKPVVEPADSSKISKEDKYKALEAVNIIAQKRCGKIKGRTCADGSKQRRYLKHDESVASPTISLESLIASLIIDAHEGRSVGIFDVPGAYLHAEIPKGKTILMKLRGEFVEIMCRVNPKYEKYVTMEGKQKVLYLRVLRAIYGCIESAMLWYQLFSSTLVKMGFDINPYDKCVANKMINGKQCTIAWYVDDVKVSHLHEPVVDEVIQAIEKHFGKMEVNKSKTFDYLGMNIVFTEDKKISIEMKEQIRDAISSFGEDIRGEVSSPTPKHLFHVDPDCQRLTESQAEIFHSVTAKLLYLEKRARPDIETAVAFLTTRVADPTTDDWKKLRRVLLYLQNTIDDIRIIGCDDLDHVFMWVDAAFAVHPNMRSQTGGAMSMGWGIVHGKSSKQKLNTKSSTESELVGVSEYLPYNIWLLNFMKHQGYRVKHNTLFQDNESAIKMEKNGRNSCTGNSRHVDIRFFFVKDRIDKGEVQVQYCPTYQMLADYFTKPLQGRMFHAYRDVLMGWKHISTLQSLTSLSMKERVEISGQNVKRNSQEIQSTNVNHVINKNVSKAPLTSKDPLLHNTTHVTWADVVQKHSRPQQNEANKSLN